MGSRQQNRRSYNQQPSQGIQNRGRNSCYLNSALQILAQLPAFRKSMQDWKCPIPQLEECIPCELKKFISDYQSIHRKPRSQNLQEMLCHFFPFKGFHNRKQADSMQALISILQSIHCMTLGQPSQGADEEVLDLKCQGCPSHKVFGLGVKQILSCGCGYREDFQWSFSTFTQNLYAQYVLRQPDTHYGRSRSSQKPLSDLIGSFPRQMKKFLEERTIQDCIRGNSRCPYKITQTKIQLMSQKDILIISLVWKDFQPCTSDILKVIASIPDVLSLNQLYSSAKHKKFRLKALLMFGFHHYMTYILGESDLVWRQFNDEYIKEYSSKFDMISDIKRSSMHPLGIIFEKQTGEMPQVLTEQD